MPSENDYKAFVDDYLNTRERLTAVEDKVEQIMELLKDISNDLSKGDNIGKQEETHKSSKRQKKL